MKKKFTKNVTTDYIDKLYDIGIKNGALGGKLTGAGGGGHMLFYCESPKQKKLIKEMSKLEIKKIDFKFHSDGAKILNLNNYS